MPATSSTYIFTVDPIKKESPNEGTETWTVKMLLLCIMADKKRIPE